MTEDWIDVLGRRPAADWKGWTALCLYKDGANYKDIALTMSLSREYARQLVHRGLSEEGRPEGWLGVNAMNVLCRLPDVHSLEDLSEKTALDLRRLHRCGLATLDEIIVCLRAHGLSLRDHERSATGYSRYAALT
jgi:hypothetical protein